MSYDSRLYVVDRWGYDGKVYGREIAIMDMGQLGSKFPYKEVFPKDIDFDMRWFHVFREEDDDVFRTDDYGRTCTMGKLADVLAYFEEWAERDDYRRLQPFVGLLRGFDPSQWDGELVVVHYGH